MMGDMNQAGSEKGIRKRMKGKRQKSERHKRGMEKGERKDEKERDGARGGRVPEGGEREEQWVKEMTEHGRGSDYCPRGQGVNLSEDAKKEIINTINNYRRQVKPTARNMLKAIWDQKASESAKKWAMTCKESASDVSVNRVVDGVYCGESISRSNFARSWSEVLAYWYKSGVNFTYGVEMKKPPFGYTQLIWDKSYRIGCAFTYCPKTTYTLFYICHYCPTGNLMNQITTPYKKGPPCGDCPNHCEDKLCSKLLML
ncbi:hypothetical protein lerEdw1_018608 [Lerista edwardsae]|nr:hypothetical protein lerEdw1_018608 [Lerista edwardsae]